MFKTTHLIKHLLWKKKKDVKPDNIKWGTHITLLVLGGFSDIRGPIYADNKIRH